MSEEKSIFEMSDEDVINQPYSTFAIESNDVDEHQKDTQEDTDADEPLDTDNVEDDDNTEDGYYFTKGKCIHIRWAKTGDYTPTIYYDDLGNEIQLNEGKTYIAIAQKGRMPAFQ